MSISDRLLPFAEYWKRVARSIVEPQEMLCWLIALMAALSGWLEHWAHAPAWLPWPAYAVAGFMVLRGIFWPPFVVYAEQQRVYEEAQKKLAAAHTSETKTLQKQLEEFRLPPMTQRERVRNVLADCLLVLEARTREIRNMSAVDYINSLEDPAAREGLTREQLTERINTMMDKVSLEIVARIGDFVEQNVGEGQGKIFRSVSGMALTPPDTSDAPGAVYSNRQKLYIDHLQHWAKNLAQVIQTLE